MSEDKIRSVDDIKSNFDILLNNLQKVLDEVRPRTNIYNTKLGKIRNDLSEIEKLDVESMAKLIEIVIKYNSINAIFNENIEINKYDLVKIIEGKADYTLDSNESYNDYFFELSMAIRFFKAYRNNKVKINLNSVCDVIIDDYIAIECKYIHSISNIMKNIKKAKKQIEKRVEDSQAKFGFIALDLSHICPRKKVNEFAKFTFDRFVENYEILEKRCQNKDINIDEILEDKNFKNIIRSYIAHEIEIALFNELGFDYDLGKNVLAIIFQAKISFAFEYKDKVLPLATRCMSYFINKNLDKECYLSVKKFIHTLSVGF